MIEINKAFIEKFKDIDCISEATKRMGFEDIYQKVTHDEYKGYESYLAILKTYYEFGQISHILNFTYAAGLILFSVGNSRKVEAFNETYLSVQIAFFLSMFLNFSNEKDFIICRDVMFELAVFKPIKNEALYNAGFKQTLYEINYGLFNFDKIKLAFENAGKNIEFEQIAN